MKFAMIIAVLASLNVFAQGPSVALAPVDHLFIPEGFDNNDNVELVVTGKFPNPCFTRNKVEVKFNEETINVSITALQKDNNKQPLCEPLKVPFTEVITLGSLQGGHYKVIVNDQLKETLNVATSDSSSIDDHLYAKVDYVDLGFTGGIAGDAILVTQSISSCLEFDHVEYVSNNKDTFSILPIMKRIPGQCPEESRRFEIPVKFDLGKLSADKVLLFVRSVDGKSVQSLIDRE